MTTKDEMNSTKRTARIAGFLYLIMFPLNLFSAFYVSANLIVPGDIATTANNIMASEGLFRAGIVSYLIGQTVFILLPLVLYKLLKPVNKSQAVLMVVLALAGVPIAFFNEIFQFTALTLLNGAEYLTAIGFDPLLAQVKLFLEMHENGIFIAQIFWGLWLLPLGYLVFKSSFIPRILGVLLMIGGLGYVVDSILFFLYPSIEVTISQFTFIGELLFPLWLLFKGVNSDQWEKRALESAYIARGEGIRTA